MLAEVRIRGSFKIFSELLYF